jgi:NADPH-dependent glutamate synthase beta subunit-like oxidoreductase
LPKSRACWYKFQTDYRIPQEVPYMLKTPQQAVKLAHIRVRLFLQQARDLNSPERATILTDAAIDRTSEEKVWCGRDMATEAAIVISTTVAARRAATAIDVWLKGFS